MQLRDALQFIFVQYPTALNQSFTGHRVANFLRHDFPEVVQGVIENAGLGDGAVYVIRGSAGQSTWNRCPWVALFDPVVTDSAQRGYYPVYLFREDMTGAYLSLNQGVTDVREQYKSKVKDALKIRAADYRARLGKAAIQLPDQSIDLRPSSSANYSSDYEAGNIAASYYDATLLPSEDALVGDLRAVLTMYRQLTYSVGASSTGLIEPEEQDNDVVEDYTAFKLHRSIERNPSLAKRVKRVRGYVCEACGFHFPAHYPGIANNQYIEAHHLVPIRSLKGQKVTRNPKTDFAVLCANCHRMIHRFSEPWDIVAFKKTVQG
jgi:5-methylcytosine-specific restriction protein A